MTTLVAYVNACSPLVCATLSGPAGDVLVVAEPADDAGAIGRALRVAGRLVEGRRRPTRLVRGGRCPCRLCASLADAAVDFRRGIGRVARRLERCEAGGR